MTTSRLRKYLKLDAIVQIVNPASCTGQAVHGVGSKLVVDRG